MNSEPDEAILKSGDMIQGRFRIGELLGEGSFGSVFKIYDTNNEVLAIKVEQEIEDEESMLEREIKIMIELKKKVGFPQIKYYGQENLYTYYIMNMLGPNLESTSKRCGGSFSLATIIETLHQQRLIHRDIKPDNFVLGVGQQQNIIHLIDFGLSKYYMNNKGEHIKQVRKKGLIGTARYASINAHNEQEQSRRDDLESIAYILAYLGTGTLPWMNLQIEQKDLKYAKILHLKKTTKSEIVCKDLPSCFSKFLNAAKKLEFSQTPDYLAYKKYFQTELEKHQNQIYYDWEIVGDTSTKKKSNTMHIMPEQLKQITNLHIISSGSNNKFSYGQDLIIEEDQEKRISLSKGDNKQFEKFEQILQQNQRKYCKMNSSKRQSQGKMKKPVIINVIEDDNHIQQQQNEHEDLIDQIKHSRSAKCLLQPPSTPIAKKQSQLIPEYIPSLNTSQVNNYDWSEGDEINSEGTPLWSLYVASELIPSKFNVMTGIVTQPGKKKNSIQKSSLFQYPKQNSVKGCDEEVLDIE